MQDCEELVNEQKEISFQELSFDEKQRLAGAFLWLIEQDKKQNPALYQSRK